MKQNIYSYFNKKGGFFNKPFVDPLPKDAIAQSIARSCVIESEAAKKAHLDETALYVLGYFDDKSGKIELIDAPEYVEDFDKYFQNGK